MIPPECFINFIDFFSLDEEIVTSQWPLSDDTIFEQVMEEVHNNNLIEKENIEVFKDDGVWRLFNAALFKATYFPKNYVFLSTKWWFPLFDFKDCKLVEQDI